MSQVRASSTASAASSVAGPVVRNWATGCLAKIPKGPDGDAKYAAVFATVPRTTNPVRLADFGYEYTEDGRLVQSLTKEPFAWLGQKHYDFLGDAIVNDIYAMLEQRYNLQRLEFPVHPIEGSEQQPHKHGRATAPIFVSNGWAEAETLVILCQGSGAVRPGMWARALCVNNSLKEGTIFTYLDEIARRGWGVVVCNPNQSSVIPPPPASAVNADMTAADAGDFWLSTPDPVWKRMAIERERAALPVDGAESPMAHVCHVWDQLVRKAAAKAVPIIAHSFGGICTTSMLCEFPEEFVARVPAIAWTDAINAVDKSLVSSSQMPRDRKAAQKMLAERMATVRSLSVNWVASSAKLDTPVRSVNKCVEVSAGHDTHEWTSAMCWTSVFKFLDSKVEPWLAKRAGSSQPAAAVAPAASS